MTTAAERRRKATVRLFLISDLAHHLTYHGCDNVALHHAHLTASAITSSTDEPRQGWPTIARKDWAGVRTRAREGTMCQTAHSLFTAANREMR